MDENKLNSYNVILVCRKRLEVHTLGTSRPLVLFLLTCWYVILEPCAVTNRLKPRPLRFTHGLCSVLLPHNRCMEYDPKQRILKLCTAEPAIYDQYIVYIKRTCFTTTCHKRLKLHELTSSRKFQCALGRLVFKKNLILARKPTQYVPIIRTHNLIIPCFS